MSQRVRKLFIACAGGVLLAGILSIVVPTTFTPEPAQARCSGVNHITSTLVVYGAVATSERPLDGSCNKNNLYQGQIKTHFPGWIAQVYIQNGGHWSFLRSCGYSQGWCNYSYSDSNSKSYMILCGYYADWDGPKHTCGWGSQHRPTAANVLPTENYGVNWGF